MSCLGEWRLFFGVRGEWNILLLFMFYFFIITAKKKVDSKFLGGLNELQASVWWTDHFQKRWHFSPPMDIWNSRINMFVNSIFFLLIFFKVVEAFIKSLLITEAFVWCPFFSIKVFRYRYIFYFVCNKTNVVTLLRVNPVLLLSS